MLALTVGSSCLSDSQVSVRAHHSTVGADVSRSIQAKMPSVVIASHTPGQSYMGKVAMRTIKLGRLQSTVKPIRSQKCHDVMNRTPSDSV